MIRDQQANPRIRTKINRWQSPLSDRIFHLLEDLRQDIHDTKTYQTALRTLFMETDWATDLSLEIEEAMGMDDQLWLLRRHVEHCRYTVILYRVDEGEVHPPHHHYNLISTQIVLKGNIHLREYDRLHRDEAGRLHLKAVSDGRLGVGDVFQASEWDRNAHWFCAVGGPALIFNINARGYEPTTFDPNDDGPYGRRYLDPTQILPDGTIIAEEFDREEAERRFQGKLLSEFAIPRIA